MNHDHSSRDSEPKPFWSSRYAIGLLIMGAIATYFLLNRSATTPPTTPKTIMGSPVNAAIAETRNGECVVDWTSHALPSPVTDSPVCVTSITRENDL